MTATSNETGFQMDCWCGVEKAWFSTAYLDTYCGGMGEVDCHCGGDGCVCHNHGSVECGGCRDCEGDPDEGDDDDRWDEDG